MSLVSPLPPVKLFSITAALLLILVPSLAASEFCSGSETCQSGSYDSAITWNASPQDAAQDAAVGEKLLLVLHLSGNFTKIEFT